MKILLQPKHAKAVVEQFPQYNSLLEQLKFGARAELLFGQCTAPLLTFVHGLYLAEGASMAKQAVQISLLAQALRNEGTRYREGELERLVVDLGDFLTCSALRGWLFQVDASGTPRAYLVSRVDFTPPGDEETGKVLLELKANAMGKTATKTVTLRDRDIPGKTIAQLLADSGLVQETPELIKEYDTSTQRFFDWRSDYGRQFSARGTGILAEDPSASHRNTDWSRKNVVVMSTTGGWARVVNDESILQERTLTLDTTGDIFAHYLKKAGRSKNYADSIERSVEALRASVPTGLFTQMPVHGYILVFHLELHHHVWVHVDNLKPYAYQSTLKSKLILPREHTDLIDILTAEMDVLMDDIVEGKSGGTTVLCAGPPGVGKTLTAEVYSEIVQRPLYRVHSGQLGLSVTEMETVLKTTLTRAQRWGAVMLIDEADVYIKRRDDNIAGNAVVGVFLRVLEYFNGLLFLTTNRANDIDEAITSRCIAIIQYHLRNASDRRRIWQVMAEQFGLKVSDDLVAQLTELFPTACGRDIKGLTKLVTKYCHHKAVEPDVEVFKRCSSFRGLTWQSSAESNVSEAAQ